MRLFAPVLSIAMLLAAPAAAQSTDEAEKLAGEGISKMLQALDLLLKTVPQYGAPEMQPNGDIIIRRLHPEDQPDATPQEEDDEPGDGTET
ncbi:hypothetical protein [Dongia rigui]|uniref:AAA+ family ATPase n=1 Tax=Dongia rigui TaxID=940149 RepID=A0ABU5E0H2_9PROT|nr:hypothetical protein [Dongia rigui]MDY0872704.1 hypothetical protein [Dongia rigui]